MIGEWCSPYPRGTSVSHGSFSPIANKLAGYTNPMSNLSDPHRYPVMRLKQQSSVPQITIDRWYLYHSKFPNGWFMALFQPVLTTLYVFVVDCLAMDGAARRLWIQFLESGQQTQTHGRWDHMPGPRIRTWLAGKIQTKWGFYSERIIENPLENWSEYRRVRDCDRASKVKVYPLL